jgi:hypothetical protein
LPSAAPAFHLVLAGLPDVWQVASATKAMWVMLNLAEPDRASARGGDGRHSSTPSAEVSPNGFRIVEKTL